jgi:hypothetical protein
MKNIIYNLVLVLVLSLPVFAQEAVLDPETAKTLRAKAFEDGTRAFEKQDYLTAIDKFEYAISLTQYLTDKTIKPYQDQIWLRIGDAYVGSAEQYDDVSDARRAVTAYEKAWPWEYPPDDDYKARKKKAEKLVKQLKKVYPRSKPQRESSSSTSDIYGTESKKSVVTTEEEHNYIPLPSYISLGAGINTYTIKDIKLLKNVSYANKDILIQDYTETMDGASFYIENIRDRGNRVNYWGFSFWSKELNKPFAVVPGYQEWDIVNQVYIQHNTTYAVKDVWMFSFDYLREWCIPWRMNGLILGAGFGCNIAGANCEIQQHTSNYNYSSANNTFAQSTMFIYIPVVAGVRITPPKLPFLPYISIEGRYKYYITLFTMAKPGSSVEVTATINF